MTKSVVFLTQNTQAFVHRLVMFRYSESRMGYAIWPSEGGSHMPKSLVAFRLVIRSHVFWREALQLGKCIHDVLQVRRLVALSAERLGSEVRAVRLKEELFNWYGLYHVPKRVRVIKSEGAADRYVHTQVEGPAGHFRAAGEAVQGTARVLAAPPKR